MKKSAIITRLFSEEEYVSLRDAVKSDEVICEAQARIAKHWVNELMTPTSVKDFKKSSWALEKAYREGGAYYLMQLLELFKE